MADELTRHQIEEAVTMLDTLCREEYEKGDRYGLCDLLADPDTELAVARLQRLVGILLKRKFATPQAFGNNRNDTRIRNFRKQRKARKELRDLLDHRVHKSLLVRRAPQGSEDRLGGPHSPILPRFRVDSRSIKISITHSVCYQTCASTETSPVVVG